MQAAWTTAALGRAKKMPPVSALMLTPGAATKPAVSWQAMYASAAAWAAAKGEIRSKGATG
jgi:hypothetical protein